MPLLLSQSQTMVLTDPTTRWQSQPLKEPHMLVRPLNDHTEKLESSIPHIPLSYDNDNSEESARELVYQLRPQWRDTPNELEFTKFTDGITNTLLRITRRRPSSTQEEVDDESILMRAYGQNTDLIIDRDREARSHALLAEKAMAPPLFARFENGLLYKFIPGKPCTPADLTREPVWRGVARKLAEWHARIPISTVATEPQYRSNGANGHSNSHLNGHTNGINDMCQVNGVGNVIGKPKRLLGSRMPVPNLWTVLQQWIETLSTETEKERARKDLLQHELERSFEELDTCSGIGEQGLVFGHLDLLSGNVIVLPRKTEIKNDPLSPVPVTFIDYEYATPCPAVYDIANHLAEWAGFDLDYNKIPSRSIRREFLKEYLASYNQYASEKVDESVIDSLEQDLDRWRGIPGFYWGIWALIQARISQIDFNYAEYAELRLNEYWEWRAESSGTQNKNTKTMSLREQKWAQED